MKVSELSGALLDYWVARAELLPANEVELDGGTVCRVYLATEERGNELGLFTDSFIPGEWVSYRPSEQWNSGGPIIDRERIATWHGENGWRAIHPLAMPSGYSGEDFYIDITEGDGEFSGESLLVAAMRSYVAAKFGTEAQDMPPAKP